MGFLTVLLLRESNNEETKGIAVGGLDVNVGFDGGLPFADQTAKLVTGKGHAMEVGKALASLNILNLQFELAEVLLGFFHQITDAELNATALQSFASDLSSLGTGNKSLGAGTLGEHGRSLQLVPFLLREGINASDLIKKCPN